MAYVAVDKNSEEWIYNKLPKRCSEYERWKPNISDNWVLMPKDSIEKLIGRKLTWEDDPVELKDE